MLLSQNIKTIGTLTILKIIGSVLGLLYSVYQVRYFGTSREVEVFFAAQSVVYLVTSLTQSGQLAEIFLPEYIRLKNTINSSAAHKAYSVVINRISIYILVLLVLGYVLAPVLMTAFIPGFSESDRVLSIEIFRMFLPFILVTVQNSFVNTILNAEKIYGRSEIGGVINYVVSLLLLVLFSESLGIWVLVLSLYAGTIIQSLISIWYARRAKLNYYLIISYERFDHSRFFKSMLSTFSYVGATQCLNWATTASISFLPQGVYAVYQYVEKLSTKIDSIFVPPISAVFFTKISEKVVKYSGTENLRAFIQKAQEHAIFIGLIVSIASVAGGKEILTLLWYGEKMGRNEIDLAYSFLCSFSIVSIFQVFNTINRKIAIAFGKSSLIYNLQAGIQFLSAILMYWLVSMYQTNGLTIAIILKWILLISIPYLVNMYTIQHSFRSVGAKFIGALSLSYVGSLVVVIWSKNMTHFASAISYSKSWNIWFAFFWSGFSILIFGALFFLLYKKYYNDLLKLITKKI